MRCHTPTPSMDSPPQNIPTPVDTTPPTVREEIYRQACESLTLAGYWSVLDEPDPISDEDKEALLRQMQAFNPTDATEWVLASQIAALNWCGLRMIGKDSSEDRRIGVRLLNSAQRAIDLLDRRRGRSSQNIAVTYNFEEGSKSVVQSRVG